jgi:hypothetical protein
MALPTVHYDRIAAATNSSLHSETMPKLHALLIAAGWTIEYANADAIGGGSAGTPAWDKTPAVSTSCGIAIYSMPLNDHSRSWFVKLEPGWGSNVASGLSMKITVGTGESAGTLTGAGNEFEYLGTTTTQTGNEVIMAASEDGFAYHHVGTTANAIRWFSVERLREFDGTVTADLGVLGAAATGTFPDQAPHYGCVAYRASDGYEYAMNGWMALARVTNYASFAGPATITTTSADGETGTPIGPVNTSARAWGIPRLVLIVGQLDALASTDHPVLVDGGTKLYRAPVTFVTNHYIPLVAIE